MLRKTYFLRYRDGLVLLQMNYNFLFIKISSRKTKQKNKKKQQKKTKKKKKKHKKTNKQTESCNGVHRKLQKQCKKSDSSDAFRSDIELQETFAAVFSNYGSLLAKGFGFSCIVLIYILDTS